MKFHNNTVAIISQFKYLLLDTKHAWTKFQKSLQKDIKIMLALVVLLLYWNHQLTFFTNLIVNPSFHKLLLNIHFLYLNLLKTSVCFSSVLLPVYKGICNFAVAVALITYVRFEISKYFSVQVCFFFVTLNSFSLVD